MNKSELKKWVRAWAAAYPAVDDEVLAPLAGRDHFDRDAMETVVVWKFQSMAHRRANARRGLAKEPDGRIEDITGRALSCNDDLGALLIVDVLQGVGPALGSAVLTAADPERYTVMDTRAIQSVRALGLPGARFDNADHREWLDYLTTCRSLRDTTGESLRAVDRALFSAEGAMGLPS